MSSCRSRRRKHALKAKLIAMEDLRLLEYVLDEGSSPPGASPLERRSADRRRRATAGSVR